jgi:5-methylcytosine-specific restriction protein A
VARATPHLCREPNCPNVIIGTGFCAEHRRGRATSGTAGYDAKWRRIRDAYAAEHPACEYVMPNGHRCGEPMADVHHVDHARPGDPTFYDWQNLQAVCRRHHRLITTAHAKADVAGRRPGGSSR